MTPSKQARDEDLADFMASIDCPVIVEGKRDHEALVRLGVPAEDIIVLNKGQTLVETLEALQGLGEVAVLTDLDGEGKRLRRRLLPLFSMHGLRENPRPRELFAKLRVGSVEGLRPEF